MPWLSEKEEEASSDLLSWLTGDDRSSDDAHPVPSSQAVALYSSWVDVHPSVFGCRMREGIRPACLAQLEGFRVGVLDFCRARGGTSSPRQMGKWQKWKRVRFISS